MNNIYYCADGEIDLNGTDRYQMNWHPDTPEYVEVGRFDDGEYSVLDYWDVGIVQWFAESDSRLDGPVSSHFNKAGLIEFVTAIYKAMREE